MRSKRTPTRSKLGPISHFPQYAPALATSVTNIWRLESHFHDLPTMKSTKLLYEQQYNSSWHKTKNLQLSTTLCERTLGIVILFRTKITNSFNFFSLCFFLVFVFFETEIFSIFLTGYFFKVTKKNIYF